MGRVAAEILRLACGYPPFARVLVADLLTRPEFREIVEGKKFRNPDTGNQVLFSSLPQKEQHRIYLEWWRSRRREQTREKDPKKLEEVREKVERRNPWAVPLWEYYARVQEHAAKKWHSSDDLPSETVESLSWMGPPNETSVKLGERDFDGTTVTFYRSTKRLQYAERDEEGNHVRDPETGKVLFLSEEEMLERGLPLFDTTVRAYVGDTPIGSVSDEWGATLLQIAEEYQRKGIGRFLSKLWRKAFPFKGSGGFSDQGLSTFKRVYQDFVRDALRSGQYDRGLREGWLSPQRFHEILDSAGIDPTGKTVGEPNVDQPSLASSDELRRVRAELGEMGTKMREMSRDDSDATEEEKEAHLAKYQKLLQEARELERQEKAQAERTEKERQKKYEELASAYWRAKQRGDKGEADRLWAEMDKLG